MSEVLVMDDLLLDRAEVEVHEPRRHERPASLPLPTTTQPSLSKNQYRSCKAKRSAAAVDAAVSSVSGTTNGLETLVFHLMKSACD